MFELKWTVFKWVKNNNIYRKVLDVSLFALSFQSGNLFYFVNLFKWFSIRTIWLHLTSIIWYATAENLSSWTGKTKQGSLHFLGSRNWAHTMKYLGISLQRQRSCTPVKDHWSITKHEILAWLAVTKPQLLHEPIVWRNFRCRQFCCQHRPQITGTIVTKCAVTTCHAWIWWEHNIRLSFTSFLVF